MSAAIAAPGIFKQELVMASIKAGLYRVRIMPPMIREGGADALIGGRLQADRAALGRRISEVAAIANIPPARLMAIEGGQIRPGAAELYRVTRALGVSLASLFAPYHD